MLINSATLQVTIFILNYYKACEYKHDFNKMITIELSDSYLQRIKLSDILSLICNVRATAAEM